MTEVVRDDQVEVPVVLGVRLGVDRDEQRRRVDVAVLLHAEIELEVRPVGRERVEDLLEFVGKRHDLGRGAYMADSLPLDLEGLLALLERLDGVEEAAVVRSALEYGIPRERVMEELEREVERRLARLEDR